MAACGRRDIEEPLEDRFYNTEYTKDSKSCVESGGWQQFLTTKNRCARRKLIGGDGGDNPEHNTAMKQNCCAGKLDDMATWECGTDWCPSSDKCEKFVREYCKEDNRMYSDYCATHPLLQTVGDGDELIKQCIAAAINDPPLLLDNPNCAAACGVAITNETMKANTCKNAVSTLCAANPEDERCMCIGNGYTYHPTLKKEFDTLDAAIKESNPTLSAIPSDLRTCNTKDTDHGVFSDKFYMAQTVPRSLTLCSIKLVDVTLHGGDANINNECASNTTTGPAPPPPTPPSPDDTDAGTTTTTPDGTDTTTAADDETTGTSGDSDETTDTVDDEEEEEEVDDDDTAEDDVTVDEDDDVAVKDTMVFVWESGDELTETQMSNLADADGNMHEHIYESVVTESGTTTVINEVDRYWKYTLGSDWGVGAIAVIIACILSIIAGVSLGSPGGGLVLWLLLTLAFYGGTVAKYRDVIF